MRLWHRPRRRQQAELPGQVVQEQKGRVGGPGWTEKEKDEGPTRLQEAEESLEDTETNRGKLVVFQTTATWE